LSTGFIGVDAGANFTATNFAHGSDVVKLGNERSHWAAH